MLSSPRAQSSSPRHSSRTTLPCRHPAAPVPPPYPCGAERSAAQPLMAVQAAVMDLVVDIPCQGAPESPTSLGGVSSSSLATSYHDDIESILWTKQQLEARIQELGRQIALDYAQRAPLVLGVLTGAFQFTGDLVRCMEPCPRGTTVNFVRASSYGSGTTSSGQVSVQVDLDPGVIRGRHVLLVEDIVDTGLTLTRLRQHLLQECGAASVAIVALLDKKERRKVPIEPDYKGFDCPNAFVVGFGLDYDEQYRTLPYIGVLSPAVWSN